MIRVAILLAFSLIQVPKQVINQKCQETMNAKASEMAAAVIHFDKAKIGGTGETPWHPVIEAALDYQGLEKNCVVK